MKKTITKIALCLSALAFAGKVSAQTIVFSEDFASTSGVALPTGWTEHNQDGHTVNTGLSTLNFGTHAWISLANANLGQSATNRFVMSTSWYSSPAASDDWLITPQISITTGNTLKWMGFAPDANYPDGYIVKLSTTGNNVADFTTTLLTVTAENSTWTQHSIDLSAYAGQNVYIAFVNNSFDMYLLCMDDIQVVQLAGTDVQITAVTPSTGAFDAYALVGSQINVGGTITNVGGTPITSVTIKYNDGVNTYSYVKSGLNITSFGTYNFVHSTPYTVPSTGNHSLKVWAELTGDSNHWNDTAGTWIGGAAFLPMHKTVYEEGTGTWCGWCPRGAVFMDSMSVVNPNTTVLVAVHNSSSDPMQVPAYDAGVSAAIPGYPSVLVDRKEVIDPSDMFTSYSNHTNDFGFADLTVNAVYDQTSHIATSYVTAHFAVDLNGDLRLAVVFTEDHCTGTTTGWDQHNYYSFQSQNLPLQGAGHNWQAEPNPILAANMEYNHVARSISGGFKGNAGSLPGWILANANQGYSTTYTVPSTQNIANMHVNVFLINATTGQILNAETGPISLSATAINENATVSGIAVYPNPANDVLTIDYNMKNADNVTVSITDVLGKVVMSQDLGNVAIGYNNKNIDVRNLNSGIYNVTLSTVSGIVSQKFVKE